MTPKELKRLALRGLATVGLQTHAKRTLDGWRRLRNRVNYRRRISTVPEFEVGSPKNVLVVTVDCLRNDHLSRAGYSRETTPNLDEIPGYTPAISAAPWTFCSVPSILTGLYPHNHGAIYPNDAMRHQGIDNPPHGVDEGVYTLAELLAAAGYETRFLTAIGTAGLPVEGRFKSMVRRHDATAGDLLAELEQWWSRTDGPKFGYAQLGDLHQPLRIPEEPHFGEIPDLDGVQRWRFQETVTPRDEFREYRDARILLYDCILREVDEQIQAFLARLDEREETVVVITSDHGDEFWEFRDLERDHFEDPRGLAGVGHGHALIPPVIEVPILSESIRIADDDGLASTVDIVPSILAELDADVDVSFDGLTLQHDYVRPVLSQEIAYGPNQMSVTSDGDHLIHVPGDGRFLLLEYESGRIVDDEETVRELAQHLPDERTTGSDVTVSGETRRQLEDLGYVD